MNETNYVTFTAMNDDGNRPKADHPVRIMDLSLCDGQRILFNARMRTQDMAAIAGKLDDIGYWAVAVSDGTIFKTMLCALNEDPWERIRTLKSLFKTTPLAMMMGGQSLVGDRCYGDDVVREFIQCAATNGIDIFRTVDALNDLRNMEIALDAVKSEKKHFQGGIGYALSEPRMNGEVYALSYYVEKAKSLEKMGADSICIYDNGGMMAPFDAYGLITALKESLSVPVHLHMGVSNGLASMTYVKAIEAGVDMVDTCLSPFACRAALPAVESLILTLLGTNRDTGLDMNAISFINGIFETDILPRYSYLMEPAPLGIGILSSRVPEQMRIQMIHQLKEMNAPEKIDRINGELEKVRKELGWIPLVPPVQHIIGTQVVNNIVFDDEKNRYRVIADQTRDLCFGLFGTPPGPLDGTVVAEILKDDPRGQTTLSERPGSHLNGELERAKATAGDLLGGTEDGLICALFPESGIQFLKWKTGREEPPASVKPKSMEDAKAQQALIDKIKAGESIMGMVNVRPEKGENLRIFNVFVDDEYVEVGVEAVGGTTEISYIKTGSQTERIKQPVSAVSDVTPVVKSAEKQPSPASSPRISKPVQAAPAPPQQPMPSAAPDVDGIPLTAPMPGTITDIEKQVGDPVNQGETIMVLEAMKMENALSAPASGVIKYIHCKIGDAVAKGEVLCVIGDE